MNQIKIKYSNIEYTLYVQPTDLRAKAIKGGSQQAKVKAWHNIIQLKKIPVIFDIGANYGEFFISIFNIADPDTDIYAFEPNAQVYQCLVQSAKTCHIAPSDRVEIINAAVSDSPGRSQFYIPDTSGNASLKPQCVVTKIKETYSVDVQDIKDYVCQYGEFVMKIDVEGHEPTILKRIQEFDNQFENYCIMFEFSKLIGRDTLSVEIIERFLDGKYVAPIAYADVKISPSSFIKYKKGSSLKSILPAHDVIVFKNLSWFEEKEISKDSL